MIRSHQEVREHLRRRIIETCAALDRRNGNEPSTAERAVCGHHYPLTPTTSLDVMRNLLDDARCTLAAVRLPDDDGPA
jgi:hypothetical protein